MSRIRIPLLMVALMAAVVTGCGNDNDPPDSDTGASGTLQWSFVDGGIRYAGINSGKQGSNPTITEFNGKLYSAWTDSGLTKVAVYNGNDAAPTWTCVDSGPLSAGIAYSGRIEMTVFNGKLYITWAGYHGSGGGNRILVAVYNGDDSAPVWTLVGSHYDADSGETWDGINGETAERPSLAVVNAKLYAAWTDTLPRIAVYNGDDSAPSWTHVEGNAATPLVVGITGFGARLMTLASKLYLASQYYGGVSISVYNGNDGSPSWRSVTGPLPALQRYDLPPGFGETDVSSAVHNGKLYLTWRETWYLPSQDSYDEIQVAVYNGNDDAPAWSFVNGNAMFGINKNPLQNARSTPHLVSDGTRLYATWTEALPLTGISQVRVAAFNGNDSLPVWTFMDNGDYGLNFDPIDGTGAPRLVAFNSRLYAVWQEAYFGSNIRVAVGK